MEKDLPVMAEEVEWDSLQVQAQKVCVCVLRVEPR